MYVGIYTKTISFHFYNINYMQDISAKILNIKHSCKISIIFLIHHPKQYEVVWKLFPCNLRNNKYTLPQVLEDLFILTLALCLLCEISV